MMYATHRPAWDAKNRIGLPDEMPFDYGQIAQALSSVSLPTQQPVSNTPPVNEPINHSVDEPIPDFSRDQQPVIANVIPQAVVDLMNASQVSEDEIKAVIYQGGFMPQDTPLENIPTELWGHLVTNWQNGVMNIINTQIRNF